MSTTVYPIPSNKIYSITNETIKNEINNVTYSYVTIDNDFSISEKEDNPYNLCYYDIVLFDRRTKQFKLFDPFYISDFRYYIPFVRITIEINIPTHEQIYVIINNKQYNFYTSDNYGDYEPITYFLDGYNNNLININKTDIICNTEIISFDKEISYSGAIYETYQFEICIEKSVKTDIKYFIKLNENYPLKYIYNIDKLNKDYPVINNCYELKNNEFYYDSELEVNYDQIPKIVYCGIIKYYLSKNVLSLLSYINDIKSDHVIIGGKN